MTLSKDNAPDGKYCAKFENDDPGRFCQALQGMAIDGKSIGTLRFTMKARGEKIVDGPESYNKANLQVNFYDVSRRSIGDAIATHWVGTFDWRNVSADLRVPDNAREAVVRVGLNGATGRLWVDEIKMSSQPRGRE